VRVVSGHLTDGKAELHECDVLIVHDRFEIVSVRAKFPYISSRAIKPMTSEFTKARHFAFEIIGPREPDEPIPKRVSSI
jgi:16S rRNA G527 N7-methylase RsmG